MKKLFVLIVVLLFVVFLTGCKAEVPEAAPEVVVEEPEVAPPVVPEEVVVEPELPPEPVVPEEVIVEPEVSPVAPVPEEKEFTIEADDKGLYPNSITVKKGDKVKIIFQVRSEGVYFGGLDFKSTLWGSTGKVLAGGSAVVEFTADQAAEFKSYWPASNRLKATGQVVVE